MSLIETMLAEQHEKLSKFGDSWPGEIRTLYLAPGSFSCTLLDEAGKVAGEATGQARFDAMANAIQGLLTPAYDAKETHENP